MPARGVSVARTTPRVDNGVLVYQVGMQMETVQDGSEAWQCWLDNMRTTTFRFVHRLGTFTARKEQRQRGGSYWYAYRKQGGRLRKGYLGRAEELTLPRLEEVATRLASEPSAMIRELTATRATSERTKDSWTSTPPSPIATSKRRSRGLRTPSASSHGSSTRTARAPSTTRAPARRRDGARRIRAP
jgi:hypothetical protein